MSPAWKIFERFVGKRWAMPEDRQREHAARPSPAADAAPEVAQAGACGRAGARASVEDADDQHRFRGLAPDDEECVTHDSAAATWRRSSLEASGWNSSKNAYSPGFSGLIDDRRLGAGSSTFSTLSALLSNSMGGCPVADLDLDALARGDLEIPAARTCRSCDDAHDDVLRVGPEVIANSHNDSRDAAPATPLLRTMVHQ